jgi:hypothetical protein
LRARADGEAFRTDTGPNPKGLPSSLIQLRSAVWTGVTRDTRPAPDIECASHHERTCSSQGHSLWKRAVR